MASTYKQEVERTEAFKNQLNLNLINIKNEFKPFGVSINNLSEIPSKLKSMDKIHIVGNPTGYIRPFPSSYTDNFSFQDCYYLIPPNLLFDIKTICIGWTSSASWGERIPSTGYTDWSSKAQLNWKVITLNVPATAGKYLKFGFFGISSYASYSPSNYISVEVANIKDSSYSNSYELCAIAREPGYKGDINFRGWNAYAQINTLILMG